MLSTLNSFKNFREAYVLGGDHPHESVYLLQHFMNNNFENMNFPRLSVAAVVLFAHAVLPVYAAFEKPAGPWRTSFREWQPARRPSKMSKGATLFLAFGCPAVCCCLWLFTIGLLVSFPPRRCSGCLAHCWGRAAPLLWEGLPQGFSLMGYYEVFFATPDYLVQSSG